MKCHSTECGTLKSYRVVCKCQYFALDTLSGTKPSILTPKRYDEYPRPLFVSGSSPGGGGGGVADVIYVIIPR